MSRILIAAMSLDIGGAETHVVELTRELTRRGHRVTVVSAGGVYAEAVTQCGAQHYIAPLNTRRPRDMASALGALSFLMKAEKFDIVHAHARIPAFLCGLLRPIYKFRFVTTAHWVFRARGLSKLLSNWGEKTLAVSDDIKTYLLKNYRVDERDITVTVNGVNTDTFSPGVSGRRVRQELGIPDSSPVVVNVSRLDKTDSAPTATVRGLIASATELAGRIPKLRIVIVGGGDAELELRALAGIANAECGREVVTLTGARTDIGELLAMSDLFVGVSRAALEACACGKPVILAGSEGYLGLLNDESAPLAVRTNFTCRGESETTAPRLASDIADFLSDFGKPTFTAISARLGAFGRELVTSGYSVARMTDDCERVYNSLPSAHGKSVVMGGYFGFGNAGDEAIMQTVHDCVSSALPGARITVLSKSPRATRARYGYKAVSRFNPVSVVGALRRCDALVFGGGSLLQDYTSTRSLLYYLAILSLARAMRRRVMIYANGIGPVTREKNRRRVKTAVEQADVVTLRDERSLEELLSMGVTRDDITVTSDPVFTAELPDKAEREELLRAMGLSRPFAVFSVRQWNTGERFAPELARLCGMIKSELELDILFLPMQPPGDIAASRAVAAQLPDGAVIPPRELTLREYFALIGEARLAVSMRLHTLIFAARAGTPALGIDVDPKLRAYLELLGAPNLGTPEEFDAERTLGLIREVLEHRDELSGQLTELAARQGELARRDAQLLAELLDA
ncbi:MAG: polysaccharide pyruvyl transferase CsaB [Oscillospiraceae bacterium]|jgi:polysaccharide pyruvyl transferase CsaB|nr:polysaccharide pyruvyl transferase CsaB [Oscillospiraceae bacterium]